MIGKVVKSILIVSFLFSSFAALAIPKGKPFQELAEELSNLETEVARLEQRIAEEDTAISQAVEQLAEAISSNKESIDINFDKVSGNYANLSADVVNVERLAAELAVSLDTTSEALSVLAEALADEVAARTAADIETQRQLTLLEDIAHAQVTGLCKGDDVLVGVTASQLVCASIEAGVDDTDTNSRTIFYHRDVIVRSVSPGQLIARSSCRSPEHYVTGGGFHVLPVRARAEFAMPVPSSLVREYSLDSYSVVAQGATSVTARAICAYERKTSVVSAP